MGKSLFTIIFLIIALIATSKLQSFIKNNRPIEVPEEPVYLQLPEDNLEEYSLDTATTTDPILEI